jgi:phage terminase large subunit GpA-like protein
MTVGDHHYATALADMCTAFRAFEPPQATSVVDGAHRCLMVKQPGAAGGPWNPDETPYMVEPMNTLASRLHEAEVFVGPARTGKTLGLLLGWMAHTVVNDPGDMLFIQMTQDKAREFSKTDVRRAIDNSPAICGMLSNHASDRNTHDVMFKNGMWLRIAWPTVSNVSGSTYRYVAVTDLDRIPNAENVDGEGPLFSLALKRTTTFLSRGMCLAESSPGIEVQDPNWRPATPHEAPPVTGILGIYNRSDRRRWYWQCPDCDEHFEAAPGLGLFHLPDDEQLLEIVRTADLPTLAKQYGRRIVCPHCGVEIPYKSKTELNKAGKWVPDGCSLTPEGEIVGDAPTSKIAGYWLGGVAAAYQSWESLVLRYLQGLRDYALTGSEETLKATVNTDQGLPYTSRHLIESSGTRSTPQERADSGLQRYVVPPETRCVVAAVDVQGGSNARFIVQVHAVGPNREQWLVDRFEIRESKREGMGGDFAPIDPAGFPEDWGLLTEKLLLATWRTPLEGREIKLRKLVVDTGGEDGVTHNAYDWFRSVRAMKLSGRVMLYKGASTKSAPVIKETMVGKRNAKAKADIPLFVCNPNLLSDIVDAGLRRETPGPGYYHFPAPKHPVNNPSGFLPQAFFDELGAEVRNRSGVWVQTRRRNESFDLARMIMAGLLALGLDKIRDWNVVPAWLAPLDQNEDVITVDDRRAMKANAPVDVISEAPKARVVRSGGVRPRRRASVGSPYLR